MREGPGASKVSETSGLPDELVADVERAGFYPALVLHAVDVAIAGEPVVSYLVQQETTFDRVEVRRHVTVLSLTPTRLVVAHADDHDPDALSPEPYASASTEAVPLGKVTSVVLSHAVTSPEKYRAGAVPRELSLTIGWGSLTRVDLEPASCADPDCEADHGYTGTVAADDITVRLSAEAEGEAAVRSAAAFARALSAATARS
ncbi:phosphodiesterase [Kineosporia sp. J2-2]|uniref:Phosphodiesterase n=1 Tax=Kineosporia corallincola TaxID=2835133 RepID=A0ABS5TG88_9ACTN|nr:DUF5998 family protein [Kineosporia corallincola]MBT0769211.1 phosphodiesterase [Kineosporia corallincola]